MPLFAGEFVRGEPTQGFEAFEVVVGQDKGLQVLVQLGGGPVVKALDRCFLNCAIWALDLVVGPGRSRFSQAVLQVELAAEAAKTVAAVECLSHKKARQFSPDSKPARLGTIQLELVETMSRPAASGVRFDGCSVGGGLAHQRMAYPLLQAIKARLTKSKKPQSQRLGLFLKVKIISSILRY